MALGLLPLRKALSGENEPRKTSCGRREAATERSAGAPCWAVTSFSAAMNEKGSQDAVALFCSAAVGFTLLFLIQRFSPVLVEIDWMMFAGK